MSMCMSQCRWNGTTSTVLTRTSSSDPRTWASERSSCRLQKPHTFVDPQTLRARPQTRHAVTVLRVQPRRQPPTPTPPSQRGVLPGVARRPRTAQALTSDGHALRRSRCHLRTVLARLHRGQCHASGSTRRNHQSVPNQTKRCYDLACSGMRLRSSPVSWEFESVRAFPISKPCHLVAFPAHFINFSRSDIVFFIG